MAHLSELNDYNLTLIRNRLLCKACGKTWKADPKLPWDSVPHILPCGWEKCPNRCAEKRLAAKRALKAGKPKQEPKTEFVPLTEEESLARQQKLTALRDLWTRYVAAFSQGKTALADSFFARYRDRGGLALKLDSEPIDPEPPSTKVVRSWWEGKRLTRQVAEMWGVA